jgi:hypothetical protein
MTPTTYLGGEAEVSINGHLIPSTLLSEVSFEFSGSTRDTQSLKGKFTQPTGMVDTAQAMFTLILPSMDYLRYIFPDQYNASTGRGVGNVVFNINDCFTNAPTAVNIHYVCDGANDENDVNIPYGLVNVSLNGTLNDSDSLSVEVTVFAQPDENGTVFRFGAGNTTSVSYWDTASEATVVS